MNLDSLKPLLSRKFIVTVLACLLGVLAVPDVLGADKLEFLKWILGIYVVGNVGQKAVVAMPSKP